jgi:hypothetical protein
MEIKEVFALFKVDVCKGSTAFIQHYLGAGFYRLNKNAWAPASILSATDTPVIMEGQTTIYIFNYSRQLSGEESSPSLDADMRIFAVELAYQTPTRQSLIECTSKLQKSYSACPVLVLYRHGAHLSIGVCERNAYKQEWRDGMRMARTSLLHDIPLDATDSRLQQMENEIGKIHAGATVTEQYQCLLDVLCSQDIDLPRDIIIGQWEGSGTVLPLSKVIPVMGRKMIEIIKKKYSSYYGFLKDIKGPESYRLEVNQYALKEIEPHVRNYRVRFAEEPAADTIRCFCCSNGLFLVTREEAEELLQKVPSGEKGGCSDPVQTYLDALIKLVEDSIHKGNQLDAEESTIQSEVDKPDVPDVKLRTLDFDDMPFDEEKLNRGEYDSFPLNLYTVEDNRDWRRVAKLNLPEPTIGDIRPNELELCNEPAARDRGFDFKHVVCWELLARQVEQEQGSDGDDVVLNHFNTPEDKKLEEILKYLKDREVLPEKPTVGDIRKTSFVRLAGIPSFRPRYHYPEFVRLKLALPQIVEADSYRERLKQRFGDSLAHIGIRWNSFSKKEKLRAEKMMKQTGKTYFSVADLFEELKTQTSEDKRYFPRMRRRICQMILSAHYSDLDDLCFHCPEFYTLDPMPLTLSEIDGLLHDFIITFLQNFCSLREQAIFIAYQGILAHTNNSGIRWTLDSIGSLICGGLTRARVQQIVESILMRLKLLMPINERTLHLAFESKPLYVTANVMPKTCGVFRQDKDCFREFLCLISNSQEILPKVDDWILDDYFCDHGQPVHSADLLDWLADRQSLESKIAPEDILEELYRMEVIGYSSEDAVVPRKLHPSAAIAHLMAGLRYGLPWRTFVGIANRLKYSSNKINDKRDTVDGNYAAEGNDFLYLSGADGQTSLYSHVKNLDPRVMDDNFTAGVMGQLVSEVSRSSDSTLNLYESFLSSDLELDYYAFRYLVKQSVAEYGLSWDGRSGVDNVSGIQNQDRQRRGLDALILSCLQSNQSMTPYELARHLCKTVNHIKLRLDSLQAVGRVIQLSVDKFCERNYGEGLIGGFMDGLKNRINQLLDQPSNSGRVLHLSVVEAECNQFLKDEKQKMHSLEFYRSLIDCWAKDKDANWKRRACFVAHDNSPEITFNSLCDAFEQICSREDIYNQEGCIDRVSQRIDASYTALFRGFRNWRGSVKRGEF